MLHTIASRGRRWGVAAGVAATAAVVVASSPAPSTGRIEPLIFVSRQIPRQGSIYDDSVRGLAGVGVFARVQVAAPGSLLLRDATGAVRTLVDGARPSDRSLRLVDVSSADVSYDGTRVVFAGLEAGSYDSAPSANPGAWRIYEIGVDGRGLRKLTTDEPQRDDLPEPLRALDDYDPAWLPDGRIVFASTRWPSFAQYGGARTSNLYVMDADGARLHRITSERNGADRPAVDPATGRIVFARWWRNHRFPIDRLDAKGNGDGFDWKDGLSALREVQLDGRPEHGDLMWRNAWQLATVRPDGTELAMWAGATDGSHDEVRNHAYGGTFAADGRFFANFYPMFNMTEAAGFGGIRVFTRGPHEVRPILGVTTLSSQYHHETAPVSFGVYRSDYATDAAPLSDGRLVVSRAMDPGQDYGLHVFDVARGTSTPLYDRPGTAELRAVRAMARPVPPRLPDTVPMAAAARPPSPAVAGDRAAADGTFVFDALNVYFNAPVDWAIGHAPPIGSAATLRVFMDQQRSSLGSFPARDWPILIATRPVGPAGDVRDDRAPANVPLFEQLRSSAGLVPRIGPATAPTAAAHVAGLNYGRPGAVVRCVGCHAGHTMIPVPADRAAAAWTNLAPGAVVTVSSSRDGSSGAALCDRQVQRGDLRNAWLAAAGQVTDQWAELTFPVPIVVRAVRLHDVAHRLPSVTVRVDAATVQLFAQPGSSAVLAERHVIGNDAAPTEAAFADVTARVVRVRLDRVSGVIDGSPAAGIGEIEVLAKGAAGH